MSTIERVFATRTTQLSQDPWRVIDLDIPLPHVDLGNVKTRSGQVLLFGSAFMQQTEKIRHTDLPDKTSEAAVFFQFARGAKTLIRLALEYCRSRGVEIELCGSELDTLLLVDPSPIIDARDRIGRRQASSIAVDGLFPRPSNAREVLKTSYPGPGGIDFKVKASRAFLQELFRYLESYYCTTGAVPVLSSPLQSSYEQAQNLEPTVQTTFRWIVVPEKPEIPIINYQLQVDDVVSAYIPWQDSGDETKLGLRTYTIGSVNFTADGEDTQSSDNRTAAHCLNMDGGLRGKVMSVGGLPVVTLPEVPDKLVLSAEAYEFHRNKILARAPGFYEDTIEVIVRGLRKGIFTFGRSYDGETLQYIRSLVDLLADCGESYGKNELSRAKSSNELLAMAEIDPDLLITVLSMTSLYRLLKGQLRYLPVEEQKVRAALKDNYMILRSSVPFSSLLCLALSETMSGQSNRRTLDEIEALTLSFR